MKHVTHLFATYQPTTMNRTSSARTLPVQTLNRNTLGELKPHEADQSALDSARNGGEPQGLENANAANLQPARGDRPLANPQGKTLAAVTAHDEKALPKQSLNRLKGQQRVAPEQSEFYDSGSLQPEIIDFARKVGVNSGNGIAAPAESILTPAHKTSVSSGNGITALAPSIGLPAPSETDLKEANDAVAQDKAELKAQQKAFKLETRIAAFMASMQTFIDKLTKKYRLPEGSLAPLKHLFAQAEDVCSQRVQQRSGRVIQASQKLADHTVQAQYLSELARGGQKGIEAPNNKPAPAPKKALNLQQSKGVKALDDLSDKLSDPEQKVVRAAANVAQKVIDGGAPKASTERTTDRKVLLARYEKEAAEEAEAQLNSKDTEARQRDDHDINLVLAELEQSLNDAEPMFASLDAPLDSPPADSSNLEAQDRELTGDEIAKAHLSEQGTEIHRFMANANFLVDLIAKAETEKTRALTSEEDQVLAMFKSLNKTEAEYRQTLYDKVFVEAHAVQIELVRETEDALSAIDDGRSMRGASKQEKEAKHKELILQNEAANALAREIQITLKGKPPAPTNDPAVRAKVSAQVDAILNTSPPKKGVSPVEQKNADFQKELKVKLATLAAADAARDEKLSAQAQAMGMKPKN